jgi:flagellar hook protein FlgE
MLRSLFAGISGLRSNQTALDVVGNNIANANTTGFKSSNVVFQDTLAQMLTSGSAPVAGDQGGTNPIQIGLGVSVGGMTTNFGQGAAQVTGRVTDLMIEGDGFFVVERNGEKLYTRAGAFNFDAQGQLVTLDGDLVLGSNEQPIDIEGMAEGDTKELISLSIGNDGKIKAIYANDADGLPDDVATLAIATFANPDGLEKVGDTAFRPGASSGNAVIGAPGDGRNGMIRSSALEMSNVDLAAEFTNLIIAQRGFQATSRVITTSDQVLEELVNIKR